MKVSVRFEDQRLMRYLIQIPKAVPKGIARGLNRVGIPASNKLLLLGKRIFNIKRPRGVVGYIDPSKRRKMTRASASKLRFLLAVWGRPLNLSYFDARETRTGLSAAPLHVRAIYPSVFTKGGKFPKRKALKHGPWALQRLGTSRFPLVTAKGPAFPETFATNEMLRLWEDAEGGGKVMAAIIKELDAILKGYAPK